MALSMSIDDFYYTDKDKLINRGNPGTHDMKLIKHVFHKLLAFEHVSIPRFDKSTQTRSYHLVTEQPSLVILEGWCVGFTSFPIVIDDPSVQDINIELKRNYNNFWEELALDLFIIMFPFSLEWIPSWRQEQELNTKKTCGGGLSEDQVSLLVDRCIKTYKHWTSEHFLDFLRSKQKDGNLESIILIGQDRSRNFASVSVYGGEKFTFPWETMKNNIPS